MIDANESVAERRWVKRPGMGAQQHMSTSYSLCSTWTQVTPAILSHSSTFCDSCMCESVIVVQNLQLLCVCGSLYEQALGRTFAALASFCSLPEARECYPSTFPELLSVTIFVISGLRRLSSLPSIKKCILGSFVFRCYLISRFPTASSSTMIVQISLRLMTAESALD